jgi:hypothetical protein
MAFTKRFTGCPKGSPFSSLPSGSPFSSLPSGSPFSCTRLKHLAGLRA